MANLDDELMEAVRNKNLPAIGHCVDALRFLGERYSDIYALAKSADSSLTVAKWDALMKEAGREHK